MYEQLSLMTFQPPTSGASAFRAKTSASQASKKACKKVSEADCFTKLCDCLPAVGKKIDLNGCSLKMLKIYLALETDLISRGCCVKWGGHGYSLQWDTLNSKDYGVPQNRERVFIVGYLGDIRGREVFPLQRTDGENPCKLNEITQGLSMAYRVYNPDGISKTLAAVGGGAGAKTGLYAVKVLKPDREEKRQNGRRMKEPGEPSFTLTAQDRHGVAIFDDQGRKNKQLKPMDICPTLRAQSHGNNPKVFGDNVRIRRLTPRECWRLQGFPNEYFDKAKAAGISDTQLYKQAGNGVTVNVARAIGERLKEVEEHGERTRKIDQGC